MLVVVGALLFWRFSAHVDHRLPIQKVEYQLDSSKSADFIGDLYADTYGYYRNARLDVVVTSGGPDRDAITALLRPNSATWFAVASPDEVLHAVYEDSSDRDSQLRVIAQIYARSPVLWIYRTKIGPIDGPAQLRGKRIGITDGGDDAAIMRTYLNRNGIAASEVELKDLRMDSAGAHIDYGRFMHGDVDLFPVYSNNQAVELRRRLASTGQKVRFFDPALSPHGVKFAANSIVTTCRVLTEHPDVVRSFIHATLRGWGDAGKPENLRKAVDAVVLGAGPAAGNRATIEDEVQATAQLVAPTQGYRLGTIDVPAWQETEALLFDNGMLNTTGLTKPIGIGHFLDDRIVRNIEHNSRCVS